MPKSNYSRRSAMSSGPTNPALALAWLEQASPEQRITLFRLLQHGYARATEKQAAQPTNTSTSGGIAKADPSSLAAVGSAQVHEEKTIDTCKGIASPQIYHGEAYNASGRRR